MTRRWWARPAHLWDKKTDGFTEVVDAADYDRLRLTWTTEKPTEPGWYWWRNKTMGPLATHVTEVIATRSGLKVSRGGPLLLLNDSALDGEWSQRIAEPEEG